MSDDEISDEELEAFLAELDRPASYPKLDLADFGVEPEAVAMLPRAVAEHHRCIPMRRLDDYLLVAFVCPSEEAIAEVQIVVGFKVEAVESSEEAITAAIADHDWSPWPAGTN